MIDLDISDLNYQNPDAIPQWRELFATVRDIKYWMRNGNCLQNVYCLFRDHSHFADGTHPYDLDDIQEMTPGHTRQFPEERRKDLLRWLQEYEGASQSHHLWMSLFGDVNAVREVWKNVVLSSDKIKSKL